MIYQEDKQALIDRISVIQQEIETLKQELTIKTDETKRAISLLRKEKTLLSRKLAYINYYSPKASTNYCTETFGKKYNELTKEENREYNKILKRKSREKQKRLNNGISENK